MLSSKISKTVFGLTFLLLALLMACEPEGKGPITDDEEEAPATPQQLAFFTAWMADCTADTIIFADTTKALDTLRKIGENNLNAALTTDTIKGFYGNLGSSCAWGPSLEVGETEDYWDYEAVMTNNLMYVTKSISSESVKFYIGIAGTNMVSPFGWTVEDTEVSQHKPWITPAGDTTGMIALGSKKGLDILLGLEDYQTGKTVEDYLSKTIKDTPASTNVEIHVCGHSLGGALAPLLAVYLGERLTYSNCKVSSWSFAGPTPGDTTFADYTTSVLGSGYNAFINSRDVVPHAWELDSLNQVCNIYADLESSCINGKITGGPIIQGVSTWLRGVSTAGGFTYQIARYDSAPTSFENLTLPIDAKVCNALTKTFNELKGNEADLPIYANLQYIVKQCTGDTTNTDQYVKEFLMYMAEMGFQHSYPYMDKFFPNGTVAAAVGEYAQGGQGTSTEEEYIEAKVLSDLMQKVVNYLNGKSCNCSG